MKPEKKSNFLLLNWIFGYLWDSEMFWQVFLVFPTPPPPPLQSFYTCVPHAM